MQGRFRFLRVTIERLLMVAGIATPLWLWAGSVTIPNAFSDGTVASATAVNANFSAVATAVNDNNTRITAMRHPLGIYPDPTCRAGYTFVKLSSSGLGYCAKLFDAAARGKSAFFNMQDCVDDGGRGALTFEILSMIHNDVAKFRTMANHSTNVWMFYANGFNAMGTVGGGESGPLGTEINTFAPCVNNTTGSCFNGDTHWDHWDKTSDVNNAGRLICVLGASN